MACARQPPCAAGSMAHPLQRTSPKPIKGATGFSPDAPTQQRAMTPGTVDQGASKEGFIIGSNGEEGPS